MVILISTAVAGLPLNLGVEVKEVSFVYFERHAWLLALGSAGMLRIFHSQRPKENEQGPDQVRLFYYIYFFL